MSFDQTRRALVIGASRGLGLALVTELSSRGWQVTATTRDKQLTTMRDGQVEAITRGEQLTATRRDGQTTVATRGEQLAAIARDRQTTATASDGQTMATTRGGQLAATAGGGDGDLRAGPGLTIETLEMTSADQLAALRTRLADARFDLVFVNAAIDRGDLAIDQVPTEMFTEVMITNALSPLRVLEALRDLVKPGGTVAVMSSEQGSISRNTEGGYELYKASKAALNQLMRSYTTRHDGDGQTKLLIDPGHNRTELGGPGAELEPADSMRAVADVLEAQAGAPGLQFLDRHGQTVPW